jgi:transposase InsO family protein
LDLKYSYLKDQIRQVITKHPKYGIDRIKADLLRKFKVTIGRDTLSKLLYIWALSLPKRQLSSPVSGISKILCYLAGRANLLIRSTITAPLQAISSDGTEIIYNHGKSKMWLVTHKDVFGQMIYGFSIGPSLTASLVIKSFKMAQTTLVKLTGNLIPAAILYHQDRGSVYTGYDYVDTVLSAGGKLSYSDPGTPTQNPGQESFHGRFKSDNADELFELETDKEVIQFLISRLNDYNQERLHTSIHNQPPFEFTKTFLKNPNIQFTGLRD